MVFTPHSSHHIEQVARALIENGAAVNSQNKKGWTALMYSAKNGHDQVLHQPSAFCFQMCTHLFSHLTVHTIMSRSPGHCSRMGQTRQQKQRRVKQHSRSLVKMGMMPFASCLSEVCEQFCLCVWAAGRGKGNSSGRGKGSSSGRHAGA